MHNKIERHDEFNRFLYKIFFFILHIQSHTPKYLSIDSKRYFNLWYGYCVYRFQFMCHVLPQLINVCLACVCEGRRQIYPTRERELLWWIGQFVSEFLKFKITVPTPQNNFTAIYKFQSPLQLYRIVNRLDAFRIFVLNPNNVSHLSGSPFYLVV